MQSFKGDPEALSMQKLRTSKTVVLASGYNANAKFVRYTRYAMHYIL